MTIETEYRPSAFVVAITFLDEDATLYMPLEQVRDARNWTRALQNAGVTP